MSELLDRTLTLGFPVIVVLVLAHVLGVPYALAAALLAILVCAAALGVERLTGERTRLDTAAGVLLPAGAVVGAAVGVFGVGVSGSGVDPDLVFVPLAPGVLALYAANGKIPIVADATDPESR